MFKPLFTIDGVNKRLAAIGDRIEQGEVPPVLKVGPGASPVDLAAHLKAAGFADMGLSRPGLALDLHGAQLERDVPDGFTIEAVRDLRSLRDWIGLAKEGVWVLEEEYVERFATTSAVTLYIGKIDGEPVGVSMLFLSAGVAGIYLVAVLPRFQRRGIGSALTLTPLVGVRNVGYRVAVLQASEAGEAMYRRLGFKDYCRFEYYCWHNRTYEEFLAIS